MSGTGPQRPDLSRQAQRKLAAIADLCRERERVEQLVALTVTQALAAGATWGEIAAALGLPKTTAFRRYA